MIVISVYSDFDLCFILVEVRAASQTSQSSSKQAKRERRGFSSWVVRGFSGQVKEVEAN